MEAVEAAAHVSAVQEDAAARLAHANHAGVGRPRLLLLLLLAARCPSELPAQPVLLPPGLQVAVVPLGGPQEHGRSGQRTHGGQRAEPGGVVLLLQTHRPVPGGGEEERGAVGRGPELQHAVGVQEELAHPRQHGAHLNHLLRLQLALGLLAAQVLADDVLEAVAGVVELLVDDLAVQPRRLQRIEHAHRRPVVSHQVKGHGADPLVEDPLAVCPAGSAQ